MLISMRFSGSSSSAVSSGITTTGLMCSASAEARRKLGGPCGGHDGSCLAAPQQSSLCHPQSPPGALPGSRGRRGARGPEGEPGLRPGRYLGQSGDLNEPLEVEHVRGSAEEVPEAVGTGAGRQGEPGPRSQAPPGSPALPVPVKLPVEPVPVALQGVRRETWGQHRLNARPLCSVLGGYGDVTFSSSRPLPLLHILECGGQRSDRGHLARSLLGGVLSKGRNRERDRRPPDHSEPTGPGLGTL